MLKDSVSEDIGVNKYNENAAIKHIRTHTDDYVREQELMEQERCEQLPADRASARQERIEQPSCSIVTLQYTQHLTT